MNSLSIDEKGRIGLGHPGETLYFIRADYKLRSGELNGGIAVTNEPYFEYLKSEFEVTLPACEFPTLNQEFAGKVRSFYPFVYPAEVEENGLVAVPRELRKKIPFRKGGKAYKAGRGGYLLLTPVPVKNRYIKSTRIEIILAEADQKRREFLEEFPSLMKQIELLLSSMSSYEEAKA
ncbi:hypothetical protein JXB11_02250 [Candidatus Woesearchaeota archaeon]|nr:hypothetical protein [Candidatus Woesearchaeota archaeon]